MSSLDRLDLTGDQLDTIARTVATIQLADRDPFLRALARRLLAETVIGDGTISRLTRELLGTGDYRTVMTAAVGGRPSKFVGAIRPGKSTAA